MYLRIIHIITRLSQFSRHELRNDNPSAVRLPFLDSAPFRSQSDRGGEPPLQETKREIRHRPETVQTVGAKKYLERRLHSWSSLFPLAVYDSSSKLPSGVLNGNVNQLGDFDLCLQARQEAQNINGQYCLTSIQVESGRSSPYILALHRLAQSHFHFKSELDDVSGWNFKSNLLTTFWT